VVTLALCTALAVGCGSAPTLIPTMPVPTLDVPLASDGARESPATSGEPVAAAYEAVFLRVKVVDGSPEVLAVGIDVAGHERHIARLKDAWVAYKLPSGGGFLAPMGAVSTSGLLAVPVGDDRRAGPLPMVHWEVFDLHRPEAAPIEIPGIEEGLEQLGQGPYLTDAAEPSVTWASGERLGIPQHSCDELSCGVLSFFDGRTGAASEGRPHAEPNCRTHERSGSEITVFDGGVVRRDPDGSRQELVSPSGVAFACLAPDDSMVVHSSGLPPAAPVGGLISLKSGKTFETKGSFAGWLAAAP
jgi:hypothetical protein